MINKFAHLLKYKVFKHNSFNLLGIAIFFMGLLLNSDLSKGSDTSEKYLNIKQQLNKIGPLYVQGQYEETLQALKNQGLPDCLDLNDQNPTTDTYLCILGALEIYIDSYQELAKKELENNNQKIGLVYYSKGADWGMNFFYFCLHQQIQPIPYLDSIEKILITTIACLKNTEHIYTNDNGRSTKCINIIFNQINIQHFLVKIFEILQSSTEKEYKKELLHTKINMLKSFELYNLQNLFFNYSEDLLPELLDNAVKKAQKLVQDLDKATGGQTDLTKGVTNFIQNLQNYNPTPSTKLGPRTKLLVHEKTLQNQVEQIEILKSIPLNHIEKTKLFYEETLTLDQASNTD